MNKPYIGLSGVTSAEDSRRALDIYRSAWNGVDPTHLIMLGALVSEKTLNGFKNKYFRRYPPIEQLGHVFVRDPLALSMIHYASDRSPHVDDLFRLRDYSGFECDGMQFNVSWPEPFDINVLLGHGGVRRVVLQAGPKMLAGLSVDSDLTSKLKPYIGIATDVLIDASGGEGVAMGKAHVGFVGNQPPNIRIAIAGGLCAEALTPVIGSILREGGSIDAEGRLRDDADGGGNFDWAKVEAYLRKAVSLCMETA